MINLSDRLRLIASKVEKGEVVADIGTDHGYIPIWLWENNISPKVIMSDISKGSLQKAIDLALPYNDKNIIARLGDGLCTLNMDEVDTCIIAGIGAGLMLDLFEWDMNKTISIKKYILQPRNNVGVLRKWLNEHDFEIVEENLVREGKNICEVIVTKPRSKTYIPSFEIFEKTTDAQISNVEYIFPMTLFKSNIDIELLKDYLNMNIYKYSHIKENIEKGMNDMAEHNERYRHSMNVLEHLNKMLALITQA